MWRSTVGMVALGLNIVAVNVPMLPTAEGYMFGFRHIAIAVGCILVAEGINVERS